MPCHSQKYSFELFKLWLRPFPQDDVYFAPVLAASCLRCHFALHATISRFKTFPGSFHGTECWSRGLTPFVRNFLRGWKLPYVQTNGWWNKEITKNSTRRRICRDISKERLNREGKMRSRRRRQRSNKPSWMDLAEKKRHPLDSLSSLSSRLDFCATCTVIFFSYQKKGSMKGSFLLFR